MVTLLQVSYYGYIAAGAILWLRCCRCHIMVTLVQVQYYGYVGAGAILYGYIGAGAMFSSYLVQVTLCDAQVPWTRRST